MRPSLGEPTVSASPGHGQARELLELLDDAEDELEVERHRVARRHNVLVAVAAAAIVGGFLLLSWLGKTSRRELLEDLDDGQCHCTGCPR